MLLLNALLCGLLFAAGLLVSGMANPAKVLGFLDIAGNWDPSLALVMAGAIATGSVGFAIARRLKRSLLGAPLSMPTATRIDRRLLAGSAMFGAGWGLAGFCPGPALVSAGGGEIKAIWFVVAMLAGMKIFSLREQRAARAD
ncbi:YeeE/YedE family protein [Burkholderia glumae]|uniref:YeeE/YedE family protein n=1 Tax=Burkholderia glumae TaxID=337 RepID=UPI0020CE22D4|nr:YeeE/YedE family protein [Burkholderia glumae]MCQ0033444.1 YeeE/YedE family protein [Burkholderia glumae]MCQ0037455.1 YeeE/YedE family protein [Burkholderia glumae]